MSEKERNIRWENILKDAVKGNRIKELHLRNIPILKNCENWNNVKELGVIDHKTRYAHYKGMIVNYGEGIFYVTDETIDALSPYRSWNKKNKLVVFDLER